MIISKNELWGLFMQKNMTSGNPLPIILQFTLPLMVGNIFQQVYNAVDSMIVGRFVGANALAAVGSTGTIMFLVLGASTGISTGFTVLTSQRFGIKDEEGTRRSVANGAILTAIVVVIMTFISLFFMRDILRIMNTPEDIFEDAYTYISIICMGIIACLAYNFWASCLRAVGNSRIPLISLVFSACLNVILDIVFIVTLHMGVAGAAWATNIAQGCSAILCYVHIAKKEEYLRPQRHQYRLHLEDTKKQLIVGIPMSLQFAITASGTMVMQSAVNLFGATAVAACSAAGKIQGMLTQGFGSMGQTMATYCGQNYGAGKIDRIKKGVFIAIILDIIYSLVVAVLLYFTYPYLVQLFFDKNIDIVQTMYYAKIYLILCMIFYIPLGFIFIFRNAMQGCGYGMLPMIGGIVELVSRLVCAQIAIATMTYALAAFCDPAAWLTTGIYTLIAYLFVIKQIEKKLKK